MRKFESLEKYTAILIAFIFMLGNQLLSAKTMPEPDINLPVLVIDEEPGLKMPKKFRKASDEFKSSSESLPSREGLDELKIAGSAQFSQNTLEEALKQISGPVWVIDLRKETHGFVDGTPISWYSPGNQSNVNESNDNILRQEQMVFTDVGRQKGILVSKILKKEQGVIKHSAPVDLKVKTARTESSVTNSLNLGYLRLGVLDHHRPSDETVDQFLEFVKTVPPEAWIYFHCRGGVGRTTTFMTMMDILHNASKVSLEDIVTRQALIGGSNLFSVSMDEDDLWKQSEADERKKFIGDFYEYVKDRKGYKHSTWSEWAAKHK